MPELPDVEVYRRYVDSTALHQPIAEADVLDDNLLDDTATTIRQALRGTSFEETRRHGKHLFVRLGRGQWLALHFGMSGELTYYKRNGETSEHEYVRVDFDNGYRLGLVIPRKLGHVRVTDEPDAFVDAHDLGPDALRLNADTFAARLEDRRGMIKSGLMDQTVIAGLGNIYTDEVLFQAGIHPRTKVQALDAATRRSLFDVLQAVLHTAIDCKADPDQMPADRFLLPHRRSDKKNPHSGTDLEKITVTGLNGYYSPARQPAP